ncbi:MAG: hypothetical protein ACLFUJ_14200 [Phycisphaerae bacterium]
MSIKLPFRYDSRSMDPAAGEFDPDRADDLSRSLARQGAIVQRLRNRIEELADLIRRDQRFD